MLELLGKFPVDWPIHYGCRCPVCTFSAPTHFRDNAFPYCSGILGRFSNSIHCREMYHEMKAAMNTSLSAPEFREKLPLTEAEECGRLT